MSQLVKLEKRFESALEKLELALAKNSLIKFSEGPKEEIEITQEKHDNIDDLLAKIAQLEKAAQNDAIDWRPYFFSCL